MNVVRVRGFLPLFPLLLVAPAALAAEPTSADSLAEVIVTGTLREQKLGEVPGSVTVLGEGTLKEAGLQQFQDVLAMVPNLNWAGGTSRPRYFQIRGVGEREQYEGAPNPSVGFLIDDIDFSGLGMPATLYDVKQIEVLRGPQGTQYGANALAGLIVVRGNEPERQPGYSVEATGGNYGTRSVGITATGPVALLGGAWRASLSRYESDGFMKNSYLDRDDTNGREELTARVKWHGEYGDDTAVDFTWLHANLDNGYDAWSIDNSRTSLSDKPGKDSQAANGASLKLTSKVGGNRLIAIGSVANSKSVNSYDSDWGNPASWAPYIYDYTARYGRHRRTGSLEMRLASPEGDLEWLVGAYALRLHESGRDTSSGHFVAPGDPDDGGYTTALDLRYRASNVALFGQMNGLLVPRWHWAGGLRVEQRRARYRDDTVPGDPCDRQLCEHDYMMGGHVSLSHDLSSGSIAYTTLSRGFKAGGFNLGNIPDNARGFNPEFLWNLEAGMKTGLAGRGHTEVSFFYQWRYDQQVRSGRQLTPGDPNTYVFTTVNLPNGNAAGMELAMQYEVSRGLQMGGSLGLLYTRTGPTTTEDGSGNLVSVPSRESAHAPSYTAALNATWRASTGFMARVDLTAMDSFYFDVPTDHNQKSKAYALANFKMGYEQQRWSVYAWLRNAFDKRYAVRGFYFANDPASSQPQLFQQRGDPRQFGVTGELHF